MMIGVNRIMDPPPYKEYEEGSQQLTPRGTHTVDNQESSPQSQGSRRTRDMRSEKYHSSSSNETPPGKLARTQEGSAKDEEKRRKKKEEEIAQCLLVWWTIISMHMVQRMRDILPYQNLEKFSQIGESVPPCYPPLLHFAF